MRRAIYELFLFLLPFALYLLYTRVAPRDDGKLRHETPWTLLFIAGLVLVIASFIWLGLTEGSGSQGGYVPAHAQDGKVVPGHFENPPTPAP
jgi:hypothetical protein